MIKKMIAERNLPSLLDREKMKEILLENEYGYLPDVKYTVSVSEPVTVEHSFCEGKTVHSYVDFTFKTDNASHTFRVDRLLRNDGEKHPLFVLYNFTPAVPDRYYPAEEIADEKFNVLSVYYQSITTDDADFENGLAKLLLPDGQTDEHTCGKIRIWAEAGMRIIDYAETLDCVDTQNIATVGHSRLGKTSLLTAMLDERVKYAISNNSGCSGAAIARGSMGALGIYGKYDTGEPISEITKNFPYWFCRKYKQYAKANIPDAFDQHFLLASIAPRYVYVASASMDDWADPDSEFLSCAAASEQYEKMGFKGLVHNNRLPETGEIYHEGRIGYHKRAGMHFLSRHDWKNFMLYIRKHMDD